MRVIAEKDEHDTSKIVFPSIFPSILMTTTPNQRQQWSCDGTAHVVLSSFPFMPYSEDLEQQHGSAECTL